MSLVNLSPTDGTPMAASYLLRLKTIESDDSR